MKKDKEFLYVGHYWTTTGGYVLKIGTTNNLERRRKEHEYNYKRNKNLQMPKDGEFIYDFYLKLSKYNTIRFEDSNRELWKELNIGEFIRNDRFFCSKKPTQVIIKIRKIYTILLA